jgi:hypothetical protein
MKLQHLHQRAEGPEWQGRNGCFRRKLTQPLTSWVVSRWPFTPSSSRGAFPLLEKADVGADMLGRPCMTPLQTWAAVIRGMGTMEYLAPQGISLTPA